MTSIAHTPGKGMTVFAAVGMPDYNVTVWGVSTAIERLPTEPIGSTQVTFSGVNAGSEIRVYLPDGTEAAGIEECNANHVLTWHVYGPESPSNTVSITLLKRGFRWQKFLYTSSIGNVNLPIFQITDLGYRNP